MTEKLSSYFFGFQTLDFLVLLVRLENLRGWPKFVNDSDQKIKISIV